MKLFTCDACGQVIYFENSRCLRCSARLGFDPAQTQMVALAAAGDHWVSVQDPARRWKPCANAAHDACNWLLDLDDTGTLCRACRHNRTIPDLGSSERLNAWRRIEAAKKRLYYTILRLRLPTSPPGTPGTEPLVFDFLAELPDAPKVMTGHDQGVITISLEEADDAKRESTRVRLGEPYRTLLGHFRHEIGHYYWARLVRDAGQEELARYRSLFGDERCDYGRALRSYYAQGAPEDWQRHHVSPYATMHPWEDWAETWAHYFHMVDTLEMAGAFGVRVAPDLVGGEVMGTEIDFDPHRVADIQQVIDAWLPLTYAVNSINRAMGLPDLYPFVIGAPVKDKLAYIHGLVRRAMAMA
jgi:hypothetical protein